MAPSSSQNMLRAMRRASSARVVGDAPSVRPRKMGAVAAGFTIGSSAAITKRKLLPKAPRSSSVTVSLFRWGSVWSTNSLMRRLSARSRNCSSW